MVRYNLEEWRVIMTYKAKESKGFWLLLLILVIINIILFNERIAYSSFLFIAVIILAMFLNYEFIIDGEKLEYRIKVFSFILKKRVVTKYDIKEMIFIKLSKGPSVLIKFHQGLRWKLAQFVPETFHEDVYKYAKEQGVKITTLGGYKDLVKEEK